jgi:NAD(P)-dependent dehydrogenase (short-subunit alcohol dehydrogenase family)
MIDFTDQAIAVTGAGRGLGRLSALDLAKRGASVVVNGFRGHHGRRGRRYNGGRVATST